MKRIFADYVAGDSMKTIAKRLNAEGVRPPCPYRGQRHPSWAPSAISVMLHNERYRGVAVWTRTRKIRDPKTGRRVQRERPKSEWTVLQAPQLQIVSQELWEGVQRRLDSALSHPVPRRSLLTRLLGSVPSERLLAMWRLRIEDGDRIRSRAIWPLKIRLPFDALPWNLLE